LTSFLPALSFGSVSMQVSSLTCQVIRTGSRISLFLSSRPSWIKSTLLVASGIPPSDRSRMGVSLFFFRFVRDRGASAFWSAASLFFFFLCKITIAADELVMSQSRTVFLKSYRQVCSVSFLNLWISGGSFFFPVQADSNS